ncbi:MAG TPA: hypothetical protein VFV98_18975 [Vicinamibacterales bacterium]|nr:hypothetical protein [Vicinamibacterales bacterium]
MSGGTAALAVIFLATLIAQTPAPPDFSGTWVLDAARSSAVGGGNGSGAGRGRVGGGGGLGLGPSAEELTIVQTPAALTITERRGTATSRVVLALSGHPWTNTITAGRNSGGTATSTSTWKDRQLVTVVVAPAEPGSRETVRYTETRSRDGDALVVEITMAGSPNSRKSVYARKRE